MKVSPLACALACCLGAVATTPTCISLEDTTRRHGQIQQSSGRGGRALLQFTDSKAGALVDVRTDSDVSAPEIGLVVTNAGGDNSGLEARDDWILHGDGHNLGVGVPLDSSLFKREQKQLIVAVGTRANASVFEKASALSEEYSAHGSELHRAVGVMNASATPSNNELDHLISGFIDRQAASQDKCPAQLLQVKHQMNTLHTHVVDLSSQVNATEVQIQATTMELNQVHADMSAVTSWKDAELGKCDKQLDDDKNMWEILKQEVAEMQMIANPSVKHMNIASFLQDANISARPSRVSPSEVGAARLLGAQTKALVKDLMSCMTGTLSSKSLPALTEINTLGVGVEVNMISLQADGSCEASTAVQLHLAGKSVNITMARALRNGEYSTYACSNVNPAFHGSVWLFCRDSTIAPDSKYCYDGASAGSAETCAAQKTYLEKTYIKAYVELSRMLAEFEELCHSTACVDAATQTSGQRMKPLQEKVSKLSSSLTAMSGQLQSFRPSMEAANDAETKLRDQIRQVSNKCASMEATVSSLDKVRDAIQILNLCPSATRPRFRIPVWLGNWVTGSFDVVGQTDSAVDEAMNALCAGLHDGAETARAAETSEIAERTIQGSPLTNTAAVPLMGTCPNCHGDADPSEGGSHRSGHARICWDPEASLSEHGRRTDCSSGRKAVLCVTEGEEFDLR